MKYFSGWIHHTKYCFTPALCIFVFAIVGLSNCPRNPDILYDREKVMKEIESVLEVRRNPLFDYFIFDLSAPSNTFLSNRGSSSENCIDFIDRHIYHFSFVPFEISRSHIAILEAGKLKIFRSINCENGESNLSDVLTYLAVNRKSPAHPEETLTRLKNYRRYSIFTTTDDYRVVCNYDKPIPENPDKLYDQWKVLNDFADVLRSTISDEVKKTFSWRFMTEESRANGFFVYDLTDPSNKQTSLLERVDFKNNHVYHFAFIDAPFSFSNIAVLENGKLKIFRTINCAGKNDSLEDVLNYLNSKLRGEKKRDEVLKRVRTYRDYGAYVPFNSIASPLCKDVKAV